MEFPYNKRNKSKAREHRSNGYLWSEVLMWKALQKKQFLGLTFNRQITIGPYIVDFFCAKAKVAIEVDGESHEGKEEYDAERDRYLQGLGLTMIHVNAMDVNLRLDTIIKTLKGHPVFKPFTYPVTYGATPLS